MTKKTEVANNAASAKLANKLRDMREKIDKLDQHILKLVNERAGIAAEIGRLKNDTSAEPFAPYSFCRDHGRCTMVAAR